MKKIILIDQTVAIPLPLLDKHNKDAEGKIHTVILEPVAECSDQFAEAMVNTYPLKYAIYDEKNEEHAKLVKSGSYPEAKIRTNIELEINFNLLTRENKSKVLTYIKKLQKETLTNSKEQVKK